MNAITGYTGPTAQADFATKKNKIYVIQINHVLFMYVSTA